MCNDHEHYTNYSTKEYGELCFKHATIEAVKGNYVDTDANTYEGRTSCEVCDTEHEEEEKEKGVGDGH